VRDCVSLFPIIRWSADFASLNQTEYLYQTPNTEYRIPFYRITNTELEYEKSSLLVELMKHKLVVN